MKEEKAKQFPLTGTNRFTIFAQINRQITTDALRKTMKTVFMEKSRGHRRRRQTTETKIIESIKTIKYKNAQSSNEHTQKQFDHLCNELQIGNKKKPDFQTTTTFTQANFRRIFNCIE